jgi:hypothetical protein
VAADGEDHAYATSRAKVAFQVTAESFPDLIPRRPYCCDDPSDGLVIRSRKSALRYRHVQFNGPSARAWLVFDIDKRDAYLAPRDALLPEPNIMSINPKNGHGHASYYLSSPVGAHAAARSGPLRLYEAIDRGLARRLGADRRYVGLVAKNPLHPRWRTEWRVAQPYALPDLASWLDKNDMRPDLPQARPIGEGRNVTLFDMLRPQAYRGVLSFKRESSFPAFESHLLHAAEQINTTFVPPLSPLSPAEVRSVVRSVAKWAWKKFSESGLSRIQSARRTAITTDNEKKLDMELGNYSVAGTEDVAKVLNRSDRTARRYKAREKKQQGLTALSRSKPWKSYGISRAKWYRDRQKLKRE